MISDKSKFFLIYLNESKIGVFRFTAEISLHLKKGIKQKAVKEYVINQLKYFIIFADSFGILILKKKKLVRSIKTRLQRLSVLSNCQNKLFEWNTE